jgi:hypothetical protein
MKNSDAHDSSFPGNDFFQGLAKNFQQTMPLMAHWAAPTLDVDELSKRINELKTVHFWLEQNARLLLTSIQSLEVQKMTLATLGQLNVDGLFNTAKKSESAATDGDAKKTQIDPMQYWSALTTQFQDIASSAFKNTNAGNNTSETEPKDTEAKKINKDVMASKTKATSKKSL